MSGLLCIPNDFITTRKIIDIEIEITREMIRLRLKYIESSNERKNASANAEITALNFKEYFKIEYRLISLFETAEPK